MWKQEHASVLISRTRPVRGPMDLYTGTVLDDEIEYTLEAYIEDILLNKEPVKNRLIELYGNIRCFLDNYENEATSDS